MWVGSGDWNDGMNRVGIEGRGESVWLGWFLSKLVADFAPLARARGDEERAQRWEHAAQGWTLALLGPAWDGQWFKRAFFDDGSALGAQANPEAKIDLIAQAWAVLSKVAPPTWQHLALAAWHGALREDLWFGVLTVGGFMLHPLVLLFALSGSLMISRIRIPKL